MALAASCSFRGSIAPASLKHVLRKVIDNERRAFPGLYCPGLIEAAAIAPVHQAARMVSGALLPRPH